MTKRFGDSTADFDERYRRVEADVVRRIERRVFGTDYGASSYTTRPQADRLGRLLQLGPGKLMLDVGSGAGWPGIYLARTTGCRVVLTDLSVEGLRVAANRMNEEAVDGGAVVTARDSLPLRYGAFDAVTSSDVFC